MIYNTIESDLHESIKALVVYEWYMMNQVIDKADIDVICHDLQYCLVNTSLIKLQQLQELVDDKDFKAFVLRDDVMLPNDFDASLNKRLKLTTVVIRYDAGNFRHRTDKSITAMYSGDKIEGRNVITVFANQLRNRKIRLSVLNGMTYLEHAFGFCLTYYIKE